MFSKKIYSQIRKLLLVPSIGILMLFGMNIATYAAFNTVTQRYEDTLTNPHQEAVYTYRYENTSPDAAPGYFDFAMEMIGTVNPQDVIQINSISDTYPVDPTTYADIAGTTTRNYTVSNASFIDTGATPNILRVRIVPQQACTVLATAVAANTTNLTVAQPAGSCAVPDRNTALTATNMLIPAATPGKITIKVSLKTSAPVGSMTMQTINSNIFFPQGYDLPSVPWRIIANYLKDNSTLDPNVMPTATLKGPGGNGNPIVGQPYTVVVSGIKAVDGANLNAPSGSCTTAAGGTGTGITNGVCIVSMVGNATSAAIPAGTANISDGGTPIAITKTGIPYTAFTPVSYLTNPDFGTNSVTCTSAPVNSTTTCTYTMAANRILPATSLKLAIGNNTGSAGTLSNACTAPAPSTPPVVVTVTCTGVPTGPNSGTQIIYQSINAVTPLTTTNSTVNINGVSFTDADIPGITFSCDSAMTSSTTTCSFVLPSNKLLPAGFTMSTGDASTMAGTCTALANVATCTGVPTGSLAGSQSIFGKVVTKTDTGESVYIFPSTNFFSADLVYSPLEGAAAPLFRDATNTSVTVENFSTILDPIPANGAYTCKIEARTFQSETNPDVATGTNAWKTIVAAGTAYTSASGCTGTFTKLARGTGLNWSIRATLTKVSDTTKTFTVYGHYVYRFQGAGQASGG